MSTFIVVQDVGGGTARMLAPGSERKFHEDLVGEYATKAEADTELAELAGPDIFVVWWNIGAAESKITTENELSGNWRGSGGMPFFNIVGEYVTRDEAEIKLAQLEE